MNHSRVLWIAVALCGFHMVEEYAFHFTGWAAAAGLGISDADLHVLNAAYLTFGICAAILGWRAPAFSLAFPALLLCNTVFHCGGSLWTGRFSPGTGTAVILFVPIGAACFIAASHDGVVRRRIVLQAFTLALLIHAYPLLLQFLRPRLSY